MSSSGKAAPQPVRRALWVMMGLFFQQRDSLPSEEFTEGSGTPWARRHFTYEDWHVSNLAKP